MKRSTLPARGFEIHPAFLKARRIGMIICLVILALVAAMAIYIATDIFAMQREAAIWDHGQAASDATVTGHATVKVVFVNYKIEVAYSAPDGHHTGVQELVTVGAGPSINSHATLRYDAAHPGDFATSWGRDAVAGRWRWIALMGGFLVLVGIVMALQVRTSRRDIRRTRAIAHDGDEVVATIMSFEQVTLSSGRATPYVKIKWRAGDHGPFTTQHDTRKGELARTPRDGEAIALLSADRKAGVLLRADLYPLLATDAEISAAHDRRQALGAAGR